ncbi:NAD-dependent epimerase/dehydratase family protein [Sphingomonas sp. MAH-20]|uniref:NAD-dependent epimerase/dehydratase family protein n=1 Tax=Sphingomonas horti TaxID=2682842 RepID=A0A6I4J5R6_9SPHN|nr:MULTISPECIES: NAD-dependent epimerase/dehydratase family protein [Sphingomonas]MBA2919551.1 NAD-dependent epimerase/dehydratase family protein [Sphingomonas sp. CGMCC 1.13658]MVO78431.1 NAD-dependent epimerase/dehydratase family protein [Sphingomonas horti]
MARVLVTGGSGYIAGFAIRQLVEAGWEVNTTIRSLAREAEVREWLGVDNARLRFFAADLTSDPGWADAMEGCSHVAHIASPIPPGAPRHEDELIVPAREGALRALRFAKGAGVNRFVMTSSVAAIAYGHSKDRTEFSEADWSNLDDPRTYAYPKSKTIAERAARQWVAAKGGGIEFVTVNPAAVLGPVLGRDFSPSIEAVKKLLEGAMPGVPDLGFGIVDVRDVADLHVRCLTADHVAGERFIASGPFLKLIDIAHILRERLGPEARKVPTRRMPDFLVRIVGRFIPELGQVASELGRVKISSSVHAKDRLGWEPRPVEETIVETARSLIERGIVKVS